MRTDASFDSSHQVSDTLHVPMSYFRHRLPSNPRLNTLQAAPGIPIAADQRPLGPPRQNETCVRVPGRKQLCVGVARCLKQQSSFSSLQVQKTWHKWTSHCLLKLLLLDCHRASSRCVFHKHRFAFLFVTGMLGFIRFLSGASSGTRSCGKTTPRTKQLLSAIQAAYALQALLVTRFSQLSSSGF